MTIAVLDYGMGNLHSVSRAIAHVGGSAEITDDPQRVAEAGALLVPGVGAFGACVRALRDRKLDAAIWEYASSGRPLFAVCLGMQVLFEGSEEDDDPGLGLLLGRVRRLPPTVKVPHMGWNTVGWSSRHAFVDELEESARFYFVHSFAVDADVRGVVGVTEHGRAFASVFAQGSVFATQFHPEKSGDAGLSIYERFVEAAA